LEDRLDWSRFEYTFVGRSPVSFERITVIPPQPSDALATLLRAHDIFITASLNDPCSNALVEALSCGLPAVYPNSGGHPERVGAGGLGFDDVDEIPAKLDAIAADYERFQARVDPPRLAEVTDRYLAVLGLGE